MNASALKTYTVAILILVAAGAQAQRENLQLQYISWPPYGLAKVKKLIADAGPNADVVVLKDNVYNALSFKEKFTYNMINGEVDTQNCDPTPMPNIPDFDSKIFGTVMDSGPMENQGWSDRQDRFLKHNRKRVLKFLQEMMRGKDHMGDNIFAATALLDTYELIPDILEVYKRKPHDFNPLALCMRLMSDGHYKPFLASATYRKLYGAGHHDWSYIEGNTANVALIEQRAMGYYRSKVKKTT